MPIDFRCSQCGKLLRTGDDTAGRQAQCPECGALTQVPQPAETGEPQFAPLAPLGPQIPNSSGPASGGPFPPGPEAQGRAGSGRSPNYAYAYAMPPAQRVSGPATALIVMAILGIAGQVAGILINVLQLALGGGVAAQRPRAAFEIRMHEFLPEVGSGINLALGIVGLALAIVVLLGAIKMKNLQNYAFAMTAAILAVIPCTSPCCCLLGMPFGIWALVVLSDSSVKAAFRS